jgi:hypothetical protein
VLLCLAALLAPPFALAGSLPAQVSGELVLAAADSPYTAREDLFVAPGARLIIEPGVTVVFQPTDGRHPLWWIEGAIVAAGSESAPIVFTRAQPVGREEWWPLIVLAPASSPDDPLRKQALWSWCVFRELAAIHVQGRTAVLQDCRFLDCRLGIDAASGARVTLLGTRFERTLRAGLRLQDDAQARCFGSRWSRGPGMGILAENFRGELRAERSAITELVEGIRLTGGALHAVELRISRCGVALRARDPSLLSLQRCSLEQNVRGLWLEGGELQVAGGRWSENVLEAAHISGVRGSVRQVTIEKNGWGLSLNRLPAPELRDCTFRENLVPLRAAPDLGELTIPPNSWAALDTHGRPVGAQLPNSVRFEPPPRPPDAPR